jgi:hypothetical protein
MRRCPLGIAGKVFRPRHTALQRAIEHIRRLCVNHVRARNSLRSNARWFKIPATRFEPRPSGRQRARHSTTYTVCWFQPAPDAKVWAATNELAETARSTPRLPHFYCRTRQGCPPRFKPPRIAFPRHIGPAGGFIVDRMPRRVMRRISRPAPLTRPKRFRSRFSMPSFCIQAASSGGS